MSIKTTNRNKSGIDGALAIRGSRDDDWYIGLSLNENLCAEGSWEKWVVLAREILSEDKKRKIPGYKVQQVIF